MGWLHLCWDVARWMWPFECKDDREYREFMDDYRRRWIDKTSGL